MAGKADWHIEYDKSFEYHKVIFFQKGAKVKMKAVNIEKTTENLVQWIRDWFEKNGKGCKAVIGISGGKDSSTVAALCVKALGRENVIGVQMPNGEQSDIEYSDLVFKVLGIKKITVNIKAAVDGAVDALKNAGLTPSVQTMTNLPCRIRMATLYAVSQSNNGRVSCNCNLSEDTVGYSTRYGDDVGDFAPLRNLTTKEVVAIGEYLGLPDDLTQKIPSDGLCGKVDEDNIGISYAKIHEYQRNPEALSKEDFDFIDRKWKANEFKMYPAEIFDGLVF